MESLKSALQMMKPGCYMTSVDLKDAYYSVHVDIKYQKFLKFSCKLYQYTCLPNGLACAPRVFTKLLKPVYSTLRSQGHLSVGYIDDSYLQGNTIQNCRNKIQQTVNLFTSLGFLVHPEKSVLVPTRKLKFLGFILDSERMIVLLTPERAGAIKEAAERLLAQPNPTIRDLAEVIGKFVAAFQGCLHGLLHYRQLESDKISALKKSQEDYDAPVTLLNLAQQDLRWWIQNIQNAKNLINHPNPTIILESDASNMGWGAVYQTKSTGGRWTHNEQQLHINALEMKAAFFALQTFCQNLRDQHVRVIIDNTTAVTYINDMGGSHSAICNSLAREIWCRCIDRNLWLSAAPLPGTSNVAADKASRVFCDQTEWKLDETIFASITAYFYRPKIDLFASRLNYQLPRYVAWQPDPGAEAVDAFTLDWRSDTFFAFPPFSLLGRVVQKNRGRSSRGKTSAEIAIQPRAHSSPAFKVSTSGLSLVRESLCEKGLREQTLHIIMASWREIYKSGKGSAVDGKLVFSPPVEEVLHFLTELFG
ncbi:uncharacterized protein [Montipora capricornis]|uniref:uncharacterized protein n=1 Tax=Montipora capricornis TaxID=246305 RepID=UPI0035F1491E